MNYPLFLSYQGTTIGNGFAAEISARGRVLATIDAEGAWMHGVNPGAIAADGRSLEEAHAQIRETLRLVFVDFAQEADDFAAFKARVKQFFNETDDASVAEWEQAVEAIKGSTSDATAIGLPRVPPASEVFVVVEDKKSEQLTPSMNVPAMNLPAPATSHKEPELALAQAA